MPRSRFPMCLLVLLSGCDGDAVAPASSPPEDATPSIPIEVTAWLDSQGTAFAGTSPTLPYTDLEFIRPLIGGARIVSLGENTHGTRDFFEMKARLLQYLVEELDFNAFAIEATWPEANRLDEYVRTGEGDPRELLSGLYFWTWNTESVLDMIEWIRGHNEAGGAVGFYGFDMQYPGMAIDNVLEFFQQTDPGWADHVETLLDCLGRHANEPNGRFPDAGYADQSSLYQAECGSSLEEVRDLLIRNQAAYESASDPGTFAQALQSLRVATQYHLSVTGAQTRDASMAENVVWLAESLGPDSKLVLWAHNFHVSTQPGAQGSWLRSEFGDDMVVVGFSHERGGFTAVRQQGSTFVGLATLQLGVPRTTSFEHFLSAASAPRFVLDLRRVDTGTEGGTWLAGSRPFRAIGCCYDPSSPSRYWSTVPLRDWYDVLIHIGTTRPTAVLPFTYPTDF